MATIIDALTVQLNLDSSQFNKSQKEAAVSFKKTREEAEKTGKSLEDSGKKAGAALHAVALEALALFAVFTGSSSLKNFVTDLIGMNTQLGNLSTRIGASPQTIEAWETAATAAGGSAAATAGSFQKIADALQDLKVNGQNLPAAYYRLMADSGKNIDRDHGPVKFFQDMAAAAQALAQTNPQKASFYLRGLGIDDGTVALILRAGPGLEAYINQLKQFTPTDAQIKASQDLTAAWTTMEAAATSLGNSVLPALDRALTPVLTAMSDWIAANKDLVDKKVGEVFTSVAAALNTVDWPGIATDFGEIASAVTTVAQGIITIAQYGNAVSDFLNKAQNPFSLKPGETIFSRAFGENGAPVSPGGGHGNVGGGAPGSVNNIPGIRPKNGARATGGPVDALGTYLIGERGPELLRMGSQGGSITPNNALGGGDVSVDGRPVNRGNPLPIVLVNILDAAKDYLFGGDANLSYGPGGGMGSGGGGLPRHPGSGRGDAGAAARATAPLSAGQLKGSSSELVSYIRQSAIAHGIDPDVALRVARSEGGLSNPYQHGLGPAPRSQLRSLGSKENSYGPYQLYISGTGAGLGDRALKAGVDPRTNWKAGIDFALDEVRRKGWDQWYGAQHQGIRGKRGVGPLPRAHANVGFTGGAAFAAAYHNSTTNNNQRSSPVTNVGPITVNTHATDGRGTATALTDALKRITKVSTANYGLA